MASTFFGLNIARSGMSAYSAWLNTTGHNICKDAGVFQADSKSGSDWGDFLWYKVWHGWFRYRGSEYHKPERYLL